MTASHGPRDPVALAVDAIADLGIAPREAIERHAAAWRQRVLQETHDPDEDELTAFISALCQGGLLNVGQARTLLAMLGAASAPAGDPNVGRRFGDYVAEAKVGQGAMGKVYRASRAGTLERGFVIKLLGAAAADPVALARFRREGRIMAQIEHPHVVRVHDFGQEGPDHYIVMEYVPGPTLYDVLHERGSFRWDIATRALRMIVAALGAAHARGVIHRDVKPQNILVARDGTLKVFDFGLAKTDDGSGALSRAGEVLGSPAYIAPEQWGDHEIDARADLFAVGVIYYQLLTGRVPFRGTSIADYAQRIKTGRFDPLEVDVPRGVRELVATLLERDRAYRPPGAQAVLSDLEAVLRGQLPDVPRLVSRDEAGLRLPLVGKDGFRLGAEPGDDLPLEGLEVERAEVERTPAGLLLRDASPRPSLRVNGGRVRESILKHEDEVQLGDAPPLRFLAGHTARTASARVSRRLDLGVRQAAEHGRALPPVEVPGLVAGALVEAGHPRALLACFEELDGAAIERRLRESERRLVEAGAAAADVARRALDRAREAWEDRTWRLAEALFGSTRENLGRSVEPWLSWWIEARATLPQQFRGPGARPRGRLQVQPQADGIPPGHELDGAEEWVVGRAREADIRVPDRSVSRKHVHLLRLASRFAFVDLGSRFGVRLAGVRREAGLLEDGDVLEVGQGRCRFQELREAVRPRPGAATPIDPGLFRALAALRSRATVRALTALLDQEALLARCLAAAEDAGEPWLREPLGTFLTGWRELALEALPAATRRNFGEDAAAWAAWATEQGDALGPQVAPEGCLEG